MSKHGKRFRDAQAKLPEGSQFKPDEAVQMVKDVAFAKFDETVEVATCLNVDPRKADQVVRGTVVLPHGTGKSVRVLVIAQGEKETEATEAGADYVGVEYVDKIQQGWTSTSASPLRTSWVKSVRSDGFSALEDSCRRRKVER